MVSCSMRSKGVERSMNILLSRSADIIEFIEVVRSKSMLCMCR